MAVELGEHIMRSGGEISRAEDTVSRICRAYGAVSVDVTAIMSVIVLTADFGGLLLVGVLFIPMLIGGILLMIKNPALLEKRLNAKEKLKEQDLVIKMSGLMFLCGFIVAGLGIRFGWYVLPRGASIGGAIALLIAYALYAEVLRENTYLSRTIEVQEGQKVIDTGLYGIVRHPMYSITLLLFISMPIVLGSLYALPVFLLYPFIIAKRIRSEEAFLEKELCGYAEYKKRVKYRLIPFVW